MLISPLFYIENISNPTVYEFNTVYPYDDGLFSIRPRTERGWTLDFIFSGFSISTGNTFYYSGLLDEFLPSNYVDNNLSFEFTIDGRIVWKKMTYSNYCLTGNTVTELIGKTPVLCTGGTTADYNITIVFERNFIFNECCEILNEGGANDLFTGWTISNALNMITGDTANQTTIWTVNPMWYSQRYKRFGTLKIYLNGRPIYKKANWEEIVPTQRQSTNLLVQSWGGGTTGSGDIHEGTSPYEIKRIAYYELPLKYLEVRDNYLEMKNLYTINECTSGCDEKPIS